MKIIILLLVASVYAESVRETETWIPKPKPEDLQEMLVSSGDSPVDPDFTSDLDLDFNMDDEDDEDYDMSGSGDGDLWSSSIIPTTKLDVNDNKIPDEDQSNRPRVLVNDDELVKKNEVAELASADRGSQMPNVLMAHANEDIFKKTEVVAALIAGGSVGLVIAGLLILLLFYRLKKKDEGTYDLGKRPIYKKAPTTEIYA
ncbi:syndecan-4 isoform X2 [Paramormyrops kingsleyae]|uniref:syndecan-4 isoform X2 n=1 Tax=Paramormyrops kingsleyae TaxID=1676925 RepID=UPI000CD651FB|nr:syndecan-4 isoform X2 [Paramormyrops kingsleyae]